MTSPTTTDTLLEHRAWLRGLTRALVRDENRADDIEQQAWLAALQSPPERTESPRAWLATVARSWLSRGRRSEGRRRAREVLVARADLAPSTVEAVARAEAARRVTDAVLALEEPYRTTVLLRFFDGLPPRDVARTMGAPVETVRTRLRRALDQLRVRLDEEHGGRRRAWAAPLVTALARPPTPSATGGGSAVQGGLAMASTKSMLVAGAALLLVLGGWWAIASGASPWHAGAGPDDGPRTAQAPAAQPDARERDRVRHAPGDAASPTPADADETPPPGPDPEPAGRRLTGAVEGLGVSEASGRVVVRTIVERGRPTETVSGDLQPDGTFDLAAARFLTTTDRVLELGVFIDHPDYLPVRARTPLPTTTDRVLDLGRVTAQLRPAAPVVGRVVDERGDSLAGARVLTYRALRDGTERERVDGALTDADGRFRVRTVAGVAHVVVALHDGHLPAAVRVTGTLTEPAEVGDLALTPGHALSGRLLGPDGAPIPNASLLIETDSLGLDAIVDDPRAPELLSFGVASALRRTRRVETDGDGTYRVEGLAARPYRVRVTDAASVDALPAVLEAAAVEATPPQRDVDLTLGGSRFVLQVTHAQEPLPKVQVLVMDPDEGGTIRARYTDERGRVEFLAQPGTRFVANLARNGYAGVRRLVEVAEGEQTVAVDLAALDQDVPPTSTLVVRLRSADGAPPSRAAFGLRRLDPERRSPAWKDAVREDGALLVRDVKPGRYELITRPGSDIWYGRGSHHLDDRREIEVQPGSALEVTVDLRPAGRLRVAARASDGKLLHAVFELRDAAGEPRPVVVTCYTTGGGTAINANALFGAPAKLVGDAPCDVVPALEPGRYEVRLSHDGYRSHASTVVVEAGRTVDVDVTLDPE